jgi:hypothetical protein
MSSPGHLEQFAKLVAILGSAALALGVIFNFFYFVPVGLSWLPSLTIADHLSAAAAILPVLIIFVVIVAWYTDRAMTNPSSIGMKMFARMDRLAARGLVLFFILWWIAILSDWFGDYLSKGAFYTLATVFLWQTHASGVIRGLFGPINHSAALTIEGAVIIGMIFCGAGYCYGHFRVDRQIPDVEVQIDAGGKFEGVLVGIYDRGSLFVVKPGNQRFFITQKSVVQVQEINRPAESAPLYEKFIRWLSRSK